MQTDPLASMRCWAIEVELAGRIFTIPAMPAADWWPVLISGSMAHVLDLLRSSDDADLDGMILTGEIKAADLHQALMDAVEEAAGRPFQAAYGLAQAASMSWPIVNGQLARYGFRWDVMPIGAALDAIYAIAVEGMSKKDHEEFLAILDQPLPGQTRAVDREKLAADFESIAGPRPTSGVRSSGERSGSARPKTRRRPRPPRPAAP